MSSEGAFATVMDARKPGVHKKYFLLAICADLVIHQNVLGMIRTNDIDIQTC